MRKNLGLRCSNSDYTFAILSGSLANPVCEKYGTVAFPKNYSEMQKVKWFYQEITQLINSNGISNIGIKRTELLAQRGNEFIERVMFEGIVFLVAADLGVSFIESRVNSTIAKHLGLKGRASYVKTKLNHSHFTGFDKLTPKIQDAIHVGWSVISPHG